MTQRWAVDLSNHQAQVNFEQLRAAGCELVYLKATEGATYVDATFRARAHAAAAAGLHVGAYHYARPSTNVLDARDEAAAFLRQIAGAPLNLPPVLDLEAAVPGTRAQLAAWAEAWMVAVGAGTGRRPMLYTYESYARQWLHDAAALAVFPLWLAAYQPAQPAPPAPWRSLAMWQHTSTATVPGVAGRVDRSIVLPAFPVPALVPVVPRPIPIPVPSRPVTVHPLPAPRPVPAHRRPAARPSTTRPGSRVLALGCRGDDVRFVQRWLGVRPSGFFGPITAANVRRYQRMRGIPVSGRVERNTWHAILG